MEILFPHIYLDRKNASVLVLEYRKQISLINPGQPLELARVAKFTRQEADGLKIEELEKAAEKRYRPVHGKSFLQIIGLG